MTTAVGSPVCTVRGRKRFASRDATAAPTPVSFVHRHLGLLVQYGTARKLANLAHAYGHYLTNTAKICTQPAFLKIEISRKCNINCRLCPGRKDDIFYPLDQYRKLIDSLAGSLFEVSLYDIGEPLQNRQAPQYVKYAHDRRIGTVISSSLSLEMPDAMIEDLLAFGLDRLIVAIDGITPQVYKSYRTNGNLALVMHNLSRLISCRDRLRSPCRIEWQMIDLPENRHQQQPAREQASRMGCDEFTLIPEATAPRLHRCPSAERRRNCLLPFLVLIVTAYNKVRLCYKNYSHSMEAGDLNCQRLESIWNGDEMAMIRDRNRIARHPGCRSCTE